MEQRYLDALQDQQTFDANLVAQEYTVYDEYARQWTYLGETAATWQRNIDKMDEIGQVSTADIYRKIADGLARLNRDGPPSLRRMVLADATSSAIAARPAETCKSVHALVPVKVDNRPFTVYVVYAVCQEAITMEITYADPERIDCLLAWEDDPEGEFWYALCVALCKVAVPYLAADTLPIEHIVLVADDVPALRCQWEVV